MAMAKTQKLDAEAAKQRKQKILLGVIGGMFLLLAVIQGPKLLKQMSGETTAAPPVSAPASTTPGATTAATGVAAALAAAVASTTPGGPLEGKLVSFSLFDAQDPFVPQVRDKSQDPVKPATGTSGTGTDGAPTATTPTDGTAAAAAEAAAAAASAAAAKPPAVVLTNATLMINGTAEFLAPKSPFPAADPVFSLMVIKPKLVKIGVVGGTFADGKLLVLKMNTSTTLVNTATGARYQIKLVYTGETPEQVETFTAGSADSGAGATTPTGSSPSVVTVTTPTG